jgi:hypothetical protein
MREASEPMIDVEQAQALIRSEEQRLGCDDSRWYLVATYSTKFVFGTMSAMHSQVTVDRRTGAVQFDDEEREEIRLNHYQDKKILEAVPIPTAPIPPLMPKLVHSQVRRTRVPLRDVDLSAKTEAPQQYTMSKVSHRTRWRERAQKDLRHLEEILSWDDLFDEGWPRDRMPEAAAADELHHALNLLYGKGDRATATRFLRRATDVVDRCFAERKFENRLCKPNFPKNRGLATRVRVYAAALMGQAFDRDGLRAAADDLLEYYGDWPDAKDSQVQAYRLAAARMLLISGEPERARECIARAPSLEWHRQEAELLCDIATAAAEGSSPRAVTDPKLATRMERLFDKIRSPRWRGPASIFTEPDEQRLEIGLIRDHYFTSIDDEVDLEAVINAISS